MNLLSIEKIAKSYTERMLFQNVTLGISQGDKVGIIGINGTGKSTLLKIAAGLEVPDQGTVTKGSQVKVVYLAQNPVFDEGMNLIENVIYGKKREEEHWNIEGEAKAMLEKLGIADVTANPSHLSGGQRKRAALVSTLLMPADILILDEPTNHLDSEMAEWLEDYLKKWRGALLMVTHDRYFLDMVTNKIWEIDNGSVYNYNDTNYTEFLVRKSEREEMEQAAERKNKSLYRKDLDWILRGARARSTKQKAHIARFEALRDRSRPEDEKQVEIESVASRLGKKIIGADRLSKAYGDRRLIMDFSYLFLANDRIGIVGSNGCGKTTLLRMLTGEIEPDCGSVDIGQTVKIGYFTQENEKLDDSAKVIDYIKDAAEYIETKDGSISASQMLERFLFSGSLQYGLIGRLSGGEKRRLYLLRMLMEKPNVLILDEPTNDLDISTMSILEDYLDGFNGVVITVSHDRYFLDRIVNRIFAFGKDGIIRQYEGGYSDYLDAAGHREPDVVQPTAAKPQPADKQRQAKPRFSYQEQKDYEVIDEEIERLEQKLELMERDMERNSSDYGRLNELMEEKRSTEEMLEMKMERWMYLNELSESIQKEKNSNKN